MSDWFYRAREAWIEGCHFHDHGADQVLAEILSRGQALPEPLVIFDLDSTLYDVEPRTHQILLEWVANDESAAFPEARAAIAEIDSHSCGYSLQDTWIGLGLSLEDPKHLSSCKHAKRFWAERFFGNEYLRYDRPYVGALDFVKAVYDAGIQVAYLTGRDEPGMFRGTRDKLLADGFPIEVPRTSLTMKPDSKIPDDEYKIAAAREIARQGSLIASFENEPKNLAALRDLFPEAMHVFLDTKCSDRPAKLHRELYKLRHFKDNKSNR